MPAYFCLHTFSDFDLDIYFVFFSYQGWKQEKKQARSQADFLTAKGMFGAEAIKLHDHVESSSKTDEENENVNIMIKMKITIVKMERVVTIHLL